MNLIHAWGYEKINRYLHKTRCCIYVLHNQQGHSSVSQFEILRLKIDNESISL